MLPLRPTKNMVAEQTLPHRSSDMASQTIRRHSAWVRLTHRTNALCLGFDEIIRFRLLMIVAGYEDGNDADRLRTDPMFKLAMAGRGDETALCSQPTISRLENLPDKRALLCMGRAMVDLYCASFRQVPRRIVLDVDDTFGAVHGEQQLRLFNAHYDEYGFQPIVVFDGEGRFVTAVLRPAKRPRGRSYPRFRAHSAWNGSGGARSAPSCAACCARSAPTGQGSRSCCGPTATIAAPRC